ncbi:hypothetical protein E8E14_014567 [Neopestalotiopsis sp. 37M]|nr:hypothetical protein E8E14_014567 [Neopestalotiopsis sp. 37M]
MYANLAVCLLLRLLKARDHSLPGEENSFCATDHAPISVSPMHWEFQSEALGDHSVFHLMRLQVLSDFSVKITHDSHFDGRIDEALDKVVRLDETLHAILRSMNGQIMPAEKTLSEEAIQLRRTSYVCPTSGPTGMLDQNMSADKLLHLTLTAGKFSEYPATDSAASQKYHAARREACSQRRLFMTSNGYLGLGPETLRKGDELHLVLGMDVPVILRPAASEWKEELDEPYKSGWIYVGQAYVHEMMRYEGDLVADIDCGRVKIEERVLV